MTEKRIEILKKYYTEAFSEKDTLGFRLINAMEEYAKLYHEQKLNIADISGKRPKKQINSNSAGGYIGEALDSI